MALWSVISRTGLLYLSYQIIDFLPLYLPIKFYTEVSAWGSMVLRTAEKPEPGLRRVWRRQGCPGHGTGVGMGRSVGLLFGWSQQRL